MKLSKVCLIDYIKALEFVPFVSLVVDRGLIYRETLTQSFKVGCSLRIEALGIMIYYRNGGR